jgi:hypothetical protein
VIIFRPAYNLRHPWTHEAACEQADSYYKGLPERFEKEAQTLASLTGWDIETIRATMRTSGQPSDIQPEQDSRPWWEQMWEEQAR